MAKLGWINRLDTDKCATGGSFQRESQTTSWRDARNNPAPHWAGGSLGRASRCPRINYYNALSTFDRSPAVLNIRCPMDQTLTHRIRERAYQIWTETGRNAEQNWLQAEAEILQTPTPVYPNRMPKRLTRQASRKRQAAAAVVS
jgi:hypothetical protein